MKFKNYLFVLAIWLKCALPVMAAMNDREWNIDGVKRTGIVCTPEGSFHQPSAGWPAVFVFHGHGGSAQNIRRSWRRTQDFLSE